MSCISPCPHLPPRSFPPCPLQHPFVGLLFMVGALLLETVLYIIRTTVPPKLHQAAARRATAARVAKQQERLRREAEGGAGRGAAGGTGAGGGGAAGGGQAAGTAIKPAEEKKED